jgi:hypothetical protein
LCQLVVLGRGPRQARPRLNQLISRCQRLLDSAVHRASHLLVRMGTLPGWRQLTTRLRERWRCGRKHVIRMGRLIRPAFPPYPPPMKLPFATSTVTFQVSPDRLRSPVRPLRRIGSHFDRDTSQWAAHPRHCRSHEHPERPEPPIVARRREGDLSSALGAHMQAATAAGETGPARTSSADGHRVLVWDVLRVRRQAFRRQTCPALEHHLPRTG